MTEPQVNAMASEEATPEKGALQRIVGAFMDPAETFADIARKPDFWAPLILMMVLSIASVELFLSKVSIQDIVLHQLEASGRASRMSPEQLQRSAETAAKVGAVTWHGMAVVGVPLTVLILWGEPL